MADYAGLQKQYKNFRVPQVAVYVKSQKIDLTRYNLSFVTVDSTAENTAAGVCEIEFTGVFNPKTSQVESALMGVLEVNQPLEIRMGYVTPVCVFYGKIDSVQVTYGFGSGDSGPTLRVTGIDAKGLLMRAKENQSKNLKSTKEVVEGILSQCKTDGAVKKVEIGTLLEFETPLRQEKSSDFDFVCEIARASMCNFFVCEDTLYFKNVLKSVDSCLTLEWGKSLMAFSRNVDLSQQVSKVVVSGTKMKEVEAVKGEATTVEMGGSGRLAMEKYKTLKPVEEVESALATTSEIAKKIATAEMTFRALNYVTCQGTCVGLPDIKVGKWLKVKGMGDYVDSDYFVYSVNHSFDEHGYLTKFTLKGARTPK